MDLHSSKHTSHGNPWWMSEKSISMSVYWRVHPPYHLAPLTMPAEVVARLCQGEQDRSRGSCDECPHAGGAHKLANLADITDSCKGNKM